ncbi:uncharacterized protein LOC134784007 [Penaeus indicus]|uniref:uncharacterized protein LOC134784007 n=1 Tax=Penaeus indicus TaxID=29960 RepID=UPI00300D3239
MGRASRTTCSGRSDTASKPAGGVSRPQEDEEEQILNQKIREAVDIRNLQFGFRQGRGMIDVVFLLRHLQEKHLEGDKNQYYAFVDLEKDTYESVTTTVRTPQGTSEEFEVKVGLHQGSNLSPLLFIIVIDVCVYHMPTHTVLQEPETKVLWLCP